MNPIEPTGIKSLKSTDYSSLISFRIHKILMICSNYDAFILEEDGQIESQIFKEYIELNLSNPPKFVWAVTCAEASEILSREKDIDMIICMYNSNDSGVAEFAASVKSEYGVPFVLLTHFSKEIYKRLATEDTSGVDYVFSWHGNADLIVAIIKLFEDRKNADADILEAGVQAILLIEDSVRYYSTYLPELYKLILRQSAEFLKETLNPQQQKMRKRSRPKIILATNYEDAVKSYNKFKTNLLGVISDISVVAAPDNADMIGDAGLRLTRLIKEDDPLMPVLLQSSQAEYEDIATEYGAGFLRKYSKTLMLQLSDYIRNEFGFGDFVFRDKEHNEYGSAANLKELETLIREVPDEVLLYNTSRNMLSKWLYSRGLFTLADKFKTVKDSHFESVASLRLYIANQINDYHTLTGRGVIARFDRRMYGNHIWFARLGEGTLGGKARGLAFLNSLIYKYNLSTSYDRMPVSIPRTIVIATEYFERFIIENGLQFVINSELEDDEILSEFIASRLPEELLEDLKAYIATVNSPLAVRSSSKLEDSSHQPFAGIYSTYMIPFADNRDRMLRLLAKAIKSVYASVFYKGSRAYIQSTGNLLSEEKMAVVIQTICGTAHGGYFYPMLSGVARSHNFYPVLGEKPDEGTVNLAFGLGKTVVDGGNSLRFNPHRPKKILQLSDTKLALNETQKTMYALDLRPGAFKISVNDSINLVRLPVAEALDGCNYADLVASTFSNEDNRIVPGHRGNGRVIVSFDALLKYAKLPLTSVIKDLMAICRKELMCDVEIEFAADPIPGSESCVFKILQVRPAGDFTDNDKVSAEEFTTSLDKILVDTPIAMGAGLFNDIRHVAYIGPDAFDSAATVQMAREIASFNEEMKRRGEYFMLIGPGRWGSSDPWLGIPVNWDNISQARMIVECAIPGYRIEPSQGTHFFQNITSLGVGYLTVDIVSGAGNVDFNALDGFPASWSGEYLRAVTFDKGLAAMIEKSTGRGIAGIKSPSTQSQC